jgi:hypothetical protein
LKVIIVVNLYRTFEGHPVNRLKFTGKNNLNRTAVSSNIKFSDIKRTIRNIIILIAPFLVMIIVNENSKSSVKEKSYSDFGITAINSINKIDDQCTWVCHKYYFFIFIR